MMSNAESKMCALAVAVGLAFVGRASVGAVDVRVQFDKAFDFKVARTWDWNASGPGEVKMARTPDDDPEAMRRRAEPVIMDAVASELGKRGVQRATGMPDVQLTYYLLLTTSASAQTLGQFLPATPIWGLPPFAPSTQSLEVMNQGSLVLDVSANQNVVWRGVAEAQIKIATDDKRREAAIREAVRDLLRRFPPKS
jgi:Domain of unknown function (DUF4136)